MDQENILVLCREIDKLRRENQILKQEALQSRMERAICDDHLSKQMMSGAMYGRIRSSLKC